MSRRSKRWIVFLLLVAGGAASAWHLTRPEPLEVSVRPVETGRVEKVVANTRAGTVKACRRAKLSPSVGGQIAGLPVREGDAVREGQLLLELWNRDLEAESALRQKEAKAAGARAEAACLEAEVARREADRRNALLRRGAISVDQADRADTQARAKEADCAAARASAQMSRAQVAVVQARLEKTRLLAPFDGVIAEINGELNEYVTPSPPGIATPPAVDLIDNSCFYVTAPIDEVDAAAIEVGMPVRVTLDAFGDRVFDGRVRRIADYVLDLEKQARTVDVEVVFTDPAASEAVLAGYSADVEVILKVRENVLRVPTETVLAGDRVFVLDRESRQLTERTILRGLSNWDYTEVLEGLEEGELVLTTVDKKGVEDGALAVAAEEST
jgi:HlyD family secretion protein